MAQVEFTPREREVAERVANGDANKEIAAVLGVSEDQVKKHVSAMLRKLGAHNRAAVATWWTQHHPDG